MVRRVFSEDLDDFENFKYLDCLYSLLFFLVFEVLQRVMNFFREFVVVNIQIYIIEIGDFMLDMSNFKNNEEDVIKMEILVCKVFLEEFDGYYDIGVLFGVDECGNFWIYSSEEVKVVVMKKVMELSLCNDNGIVMDVVFDFGYQSDSSDVIVLFSVLSYRCVDLDFGQMFIQILFSFFGFLIVGDLNCNYVKILWLISDQFKVLNLKLGENLMSFIVNCVICLVYMYFWKYEVLVVIFDIDGIIIKLDVLGYVLNMIGCDWIYVGVVKLYIDIVVNGYNIMYLMSCFVG